MSRSYVLKKVEVHVKLFLELLDLLGLDLGCNGVDFGSCEVVVVVERHVEGAVVIELVKKAVVEVTELVGTWF